MQPLVSLVIIYLGEMANIIEKQAAGGHDSIIRHFMQNQLDLTGTGGACFSVLRITQNQLFGFPCSGTPLSFLFCKLFPKCL